MVISMLLQKAHQSMDSSSCYFSQKCACAGIIRVIQPPTFGDYHVRQELLLLACLWRTAVEYTILYSCCIHSPIALLLALIRVYSKYIKEILQM